jgi:hypothetical protein
MYRYREIEFILCTESLLARFSCLKNGHRCIISCTYRSCWNMPYQEVDIRDLAVGEVGRAEDIFFNLIFR